MEDFIKGIVIATDHGLINRRLAVAYISAFVRENYNINFTDKELKALV